MGFLGTFWGLSFPTWPISKTSMSFGIPVWTPKLSQNVIHMAAPCRPPAVMMYYGSGLGSVFGWDMLGHFGPSWAHLGLSWAHLKPFSAHLGLLLGRLGPSWAHLGPSQAHLGPSWAVLGSS